MDTTISYGIMVWFYQNSSLFYQLVALDKKMVALASRIDHLLIKLHNVLIDSVDRAHDLPSDGSDSITITSHIDSPEHCLLEGIGVVGDMQSHA